MDRAGGVGDGAGRNGAGLDGLLHGYLQVVHVVEGVKNADDVNAVFHRLPDKHPDKIVGIVGITQDVLAPEQHLQLGIGHLGPNLPQALPGILVQVAQADVKGCAAPALTGVVTGLVHGGQNRLKFVVGQAGRNERLVGVPQHGLYELDFLDLLFSILCHMAKPP